MSIEQAAKYVFLVVWHEDGSRNFEIFESRALAENYSRKIPQFNPWLLSAPVRTTEYQGRAA
jgi:hypothetical protein